MLLRLQQICWTFGPYIKFNKGKSAKITKNVFVFFFGHSFLYEYSGNLIPFAYYWNLAILSIDSIFEHILCHFDIVLYWPFYYFGHNGITFTYFCKKLWPKHKECHLLATFNWFFCYLYQMSSKFVVALTFIWEQYKIMPFLFTGHMYLKI